MSPLVVVRNWVPMGILVFAVGYVVGHPDWVGACVYGLGLAMWGVAGWLDGWSLSAENAEARAEIATLRAELQKLRTRDR